MQRADSAVYIDAFHPRVLWNSSHPFSQQIRGHQDKKPDILAETKHSAAESVRGTPESLLAEQSDSTY